MLAVHYWGMDKWYYCFPILGFITLLSTVWLIATPIERGRNVVSNSDLSMRNTFALLKDRTILLLFLGIFFIVGVDVATNFISSKLMSIRFGWSDEQVKFAPQVYFPVTIRAGNVRKNWIRFMTLRLKIRKRFEFSSCY